MDFVHKTIGGIPTVPGHHPFNKAPKASNPVERLAEKLNKREPNTEDDLVMACIYALMRSHDPSDPSKSPRPEELRPAIDETAKALLSCLGARGGFTDRQRGAVEGASCLALGLVGLGVVALNSAWGWATGPDPLDVSSAELLVEAAQMQDFDAIVQGLKRAVLRRMAKVPKPAEETKVSKPIGSVRRIGQVAIIAELTGSKGWLY